MIRTVSACGELVKLDQLAATAAAILRAADFAAHAHRAQRDKGPAAGPYINHLIEVARLLAEADAPLPVVIAGLLHDTIEDTAITAALLEAEFGAEVKALVVEVTDDKALPKAERKARQVANAPHKSPGGKMIKIADKTSNLRRLVRTPPDWDAARKRDYFTWAASVVAGCRGANAVLEAAFDAALAEGLASLEAA
jgi:(p)ppGpp synthase/HD superfamily hydrolase